MLNAQLEDLCLIAVSFICKWRIPWSGQMVGLDGLCRLFFLLDYSIQFCSIWFCSVLPLTAITIANNRTLLKKVVLKFSFNEIKLGDGG